MCSTFLQFRNDETDKKKKSNMQKLLEYIVE